MVGGPNSTSADNKHTDMGSKLVSSPSHKVKDTGGASTFQKSNSLLRSLPR